MAEKKKTAKTPKARTPTQAKDPGRDQREQRGANNAAFGQRLFDNAYKRKLDVEQRRRTSSSSPIGPIRDKGINGSDSHGNRMRDLAIAVNKDTNRAIDFRNQTDKQSNAEARRELGPVNRSVRDRSAAARKAAATRKARGK